MTNQSALWLQVREQKALNLACRGKGTPQAGTRMSRCPWHILEGKKKKGEGSPGRQKQERNQGEGEPWGPQGLWEGRLCRV